MIFRRKRNVVIPEVRRLSLQPGDSLLVTVPANLGMDQCNAIREAFEGNLDRTTVLVVSDSLDVTVLSEERQAA